jgi:hypothetical protein
MFELYLKSAENTTRFSIYLHTSSGIEWQVHYIVKMKV